MAFQALEKIEGIVDIAGVEAQLWSVVPTGTPIEAGFDGADLYEMWRDGEDSWLYERARYTDRTSDYADKDVVFCPDCSGGSGYIKADATPVNE
jgi:hypothetical protein